MTIAQSLMDRSRATLIDSAAVTWTDAELLAYLNAGIAQACGTLIDLYVVNAMVAMVAGVRQTLPAGGMVLFDVLRTAIGGAVRQASSEEFAKTMPNWPAATASASTIYYFYDKRSPMSFMVYPPATAGAQIEISYGATPAAVLATDVIPISPAFDTALWAYINAMALTKNTKRQNLADSQMYFGIYSSVLGTWQKQAQGMATEPDPKGIY